jgi:hypothetical protein
MMAKPCPFCGEPANTFGNPGDLRAGCLNEDCIAYDLHYFPLEVWDYRPIEDKLNDFIDQKERVIQMMERGTW